MRTLIVSLAISAAALAAQAQQKNAYEAFEQLAIKTYGAQNEELVYQAFGKDLKLLDDGQWVHPSLNSAAVCFETNLPAKAYVEYGKDDKFGQKTKPYTRHHYIHVHYVTGLEPDTQYKYRIVATDERGNEIKGPAGTFKTIADADIVKIPGDASKAPFKLESGKKYVLTADLTVDGTAFETVERFSDVTLDLNGHKVVYNNKAMGKIEGDFWAWARQSAVGVRAMRGKGFKLLNGQIVQGAGQDAAQANSIGFNPVYTTGVGDMEMAGVTIEYGGPQQVGVFNHYSGSQSRFHHNVFKDTGTEVPNRHGSGCRSLYFFSETSGAKADRNLVLRTRQSGINGPEICNNEIYVDSWATNSFATGGQKVYKNRIFGTGYHFVGVGWGNGIEVTDNFIHAMSEHITGRFEEYGDQASVNGIRLTQYGGSKKPYENNVYTGNFISVSSRGEQQARGVQFFSDPHVKNLVFRKNVIKAMVLDDKTKQVACVVTQGLQDRTDQHEPIVYEDCTFISNICNIRFGDYYGVGSNHRFTRCTLIKVGEDKRYTTFKFDNGYPCKYHVLTDCKFENGTAADSVTWPQGTAENSQYTIAWTLKLTTAPNAQIVVTDKAGNEAFSGKADATGKADIALKQFLATKAGLNALTPHTVKVAAEDKKAEKQVEMTKPTELTLQP